MAWTDPNYPTDAGSFLQHTYQGEQLMNNQMYYYGGGMMPSYMTQPVSSPFDNSGSRRNMTGFDPNMGNLNPSQGGTVVPNFNQQPAFNSLVSGSQGIPMNGSNPWDVKPLTTPSLTSNTISQPNYCQQPCLCGYQQTYPTPLSYDHRGSAWDTQPMRYAAPMTNINWNTAPLNPSAYNYCQQPVFTPNFPAVQPSWSEIVDRNFGIK